MKAFSKLGTSIVSLPGCVGGSVVNGKMTNKGRLARFSVIMAVAAYVLSDDIVL